MSTILQTTWCKDELYKVPKQCTHIPLPILTIFPAILLKEKYTFQWDDDDVHFGLDQHAYLDFYSASSMKQQSTDRHVAPLGHVILIPS